MSKINYKVLNKNGEYNNKNIHLAQTYYCLTEKGVNPLKMLAFRENLKPIVLEIDNKKYI